MGEYEEFDKVGPGSGRGPGDDEQSDVSTDTEEAMERGEAEYARKGSSLHGVRDSDLPTSADARPGASSARGGGDDDDDDQDDGDGMANYPPGWRGSLLTVLDSLQFQAFVFLLVVVDASLLIVDVTAGVDGEESRAAWYVSLVILSVLAVELFLRLIAEGSAFFKSWWNAFDTAIVTASIALLFAEKDDASPRFILLLRLGRGGLRLIRVALRLYRTKRRLNEAARRYVTKNKQRYRWGGFDLDLCYVTPRIMVMSVPATGREALYRNHINDVARFLDTKHGRGRYCVFNITSEKSYPESKFHGAVQRYPVDDHNTPTLTQYLDFCATVGEHFAADEDNVAVVHCKGGKGRSGSMVCAYLLASGRCATAKEALDLFGERRTDKSIPGKIQGVETPSQRRYIYYIERYLADKALRDSARGTWLHLRAVEITVEPGAQGWTRWSARILASDGERRAPSDLPAFRPPSEALPDEALREEEGIVEERAGGRFHTKMLAMDFEDVQVRDDVRIGIYACPPGASSDDAAGGTGGSGGAGGAGGAGGSGGDASAAAHTVAPDGALLLCYMWVHTGFAAAEASAPGRAIPPVRFTKVELDRSRATRGNPFRKLEMCDIALHFEPVKSALAGGKFRL